MKLAVKFEELDQSMVVEFGEVQNLSDGGYESGYSAGYNRGHTDGLAERKYETWEITLVDGTVIEKDVALL